MLGQNVGTLTLDGEVSIPEGAQSDMMIVGSPLTAVITEGSTVTVGGTLITTANDEIVVNGQLIVSETGVVNLTNSTITLQPNGSMTVAAGNNNNIPTPTAAEGYTLVTADMNGDTVYTVTAETTEEPGTTPEVPEGEKVSTDEEFNEALGKEDDIVIVAPNDQQEDEPFTVTITNTTAVSVGGKTITVTNSTVLVLDSADAVNTIWATAAPWSSRPAIPCGSLLLCLAFLPAERAPSPPCCPPPVFVCWRQHRTIQWLTLLVRAMTRSSSWKTIAPQAGTAVS